MANNKKPLSDEARKARNAYLKRWRRKNPERVAEIQRRYWEKLALKAAAEQEQADDGQDG